MMTFHQIFWPDAPGCIVFNNLCTDRCHSRGSGPLSNKQDRCNTLRSTVHRILEAIPSQRRKTTRGVNYFQAAGTEAFNRLEEVVTVLSSEGNDEEGMMDRTWSKQVRVLFNLCLFHSR